MNTTKLSELSASGSLNTLDFYEQPSVVKNHSTKHVDPPSDFEIPIFCIHDPIMCEVGFTTIARLAQEDCIRIRKTQHPKWGRVRYWAEYRHSKMGWIIHESDYDMLQAYIQNGIQIHDHTHSPIQAIN